MRSFVVESRGWLARSVALLVVLALLTPAAVSAATYEETDYRRGTIEEPADGVTVISIQGFHYKKTGSRKKPARLIGVGPRGELRWVHDGSSVGARWFYDVDPLSNGNLLVVATNRNGTLVYEFNPKTQRQVWVETFDMDDTHDVDLINGDQLLIANMRGYDKETDVNRARILIYNRSTDETIWEWRLIDHPRYNRSGGGKYKGDWTHLNDVDKIGPGRYLASVRNFDQVIVVNRTTGEIDLQLGDDDAHSVMYEQHNPQYLEATDGTPTLLIADSESDRILEYERRGDRWVHTWKLSGTFSWPRDADRLPNGNTLIVDSLNHRVVEVTPAGEIVWEVYAPWGTYDVERITYGDEGAAAGELPTISDMNATGNYTLSGSAGLEPGTGDRITFAQWLTAVFADTPVESQVKWIANRWAHITPWIYPVWMTGWDFAGVVGAFVIVLGWGIGELTVRRHRILTAFRRHVP